ncbi:MAG: polyhydroxyalkanoic acid system family protein [Gammaproteobacteria bacterium]|nr:polyhydroxyalkanoic acid system family protein [Gammaproteobacteria bacterium]MBU2676777.1 polyhydroxyalkanoic acid system family protein [Gammaproteobacteria bacterium]NNL50511.1 polyhydroxyalkanoic acid system protein [Woeseiaceae bacterium]
MKIRRSHQLGSEEARRRADEIAGHLGRQFSLTSRWQGDRLLVSGNGVNGFLHVEDDSIELEVRLGFALKLMEGPIRSAIENTIDEHLV